jgi:hypothetical protein
MLVAHHPPRGRIPVTAIVGVGIDPLLRELGQRDEPALACEGRKHRVLLRMRAIEVSAPVEVLEAVDDQLANSASVRLEDIEDEAISTEFRGGWKVIGGNDPVDDGAEERLIVSGEHAPSVRPARSP